MARTVVLDFPQWQGSGSSEARNLVQGTSRLLDHWRRLTGAHSEAGPGALPGSDGVEGPDGDDITVVVTVPVRPEAGVEVGGINNLAEVLTHARWAVAALYEHRADRVITLGGDCGVEMAPVAYANDRHPNLTVLWLDAHADANSPERSPSHAFHGMVLRHLAGEGHGQLKLSPELRVEPTQFVLAGARDLDPDEEAFIAAHRLTCLPPDRTTAADVVAELAQRGGPVYIHLDLDVLDPSEFGSVGYPIDGGPSVDRVEQLLRAVHQNLDVVGMSMTEYLPSPPSSTGAPNVDPGSTTAADDDDRDEATVLRLLAGLTNR